MSRIQKYNFLGDSGLKVADICLGTMTFGKEEAGSRPNNLDEAASHAIMDRYAALGGNFLDTADVYQSGGSERIIGNWLQKQKREEFVIATKVRFNVNPTHPNQKGLSRRHIMWSVEESLKRLQTDYIDLYQFHCWDNAVPLEETLLAMNDLVRAGKVRYLGASNVSGWQLQKVADYSKHMGLNKFISLQQQYSLLCREPEWELIDVCRNEGIGYLPWTPLKGGWLSGKYKKDMQGPAQDSRVGWVSQDKKRILQSQPSWDMFNNEKTWHLLGLMEKIGQAHGKSVAQVALRWLLQRPTVASVIIGVTKPEQLEDNMGASGGWELTDEEMNELSDASAVPVPYPYELLLRTNKDRKPLGV